MTRTLLLCCHPAHGKCAYISHPFHVLQLLGGSHELMQSVDCCLHSPSSKEGSLVQELLGGIILGYIHMAHHNIITTEESFGTSAVAQWQ
jgi:hypothetical protein